ncbi:hypothetical protein [Roseivirga sp.]|uniref:hypothetical protein n=1 Tax=Roseivirga sp. TaxID=1964215 RepID=UPI002B26A28D|nr:hypothetical protein [Roseivirga sp.]
MIKFFRKIRQKMLTENKLRMYFSYAIGEIILVVIGILLALQINNLNEDRKVRNQEKDLISGLIRDLGKDIHLLEIINTYDSLQIISDRTILAAFTTDSIRNNKTLIQKQIANGLLTIDFTVSKTFYEDLKNNGKINYLANDSIRDAVEDYYANMENMNGVFDKNDVSIRDVSVKIGTYLDINSSFQAMIPEFGKQELDEFDNSIFYEPIESPKVKELANLISMRQALKSMVLNIHKIALSDAKALKELLTNYLEEK